MIDRAKPVPNGGFVAVGDRWNYAGALTFANATAVFEGSSDGIYDWDLASNMMFLSHRCQQLYGLEPGDPIRPWPEWVARVTIHPDEAPRQQRIPKAVHQIDEEVAQPQVPTLLQDLERQLQRVDTRPSAP